MPEITEDGFDAFRKGVNWDDFLDGRTRRLVHGLDISSVETGRVSAHQAAKARSRDCRTLADGEDLIVQFSNEAGDYEPHDQPAVNKGSGDRNAMQRPKGAATNSQRPNTRNQPCG